MVNSSLGLIVTAKQKYYPIELSNAELLSHYETIQDYHQEVSHNILQSNCKFKPVVKLMSQQPEMPPSTRHQMVSFLFQLSCKTRVTNGIFYQSCRLYDRYCSKRIVLKDQSKLVIATCLWLAAKTWGGCNHIINNVAVPTGGRFYGPNPRARIPRLTELVHYCGGANESFDESMFIQMERHILDTLQWDVYEPMLNDYLLNVDENCLSQYELYQKQLQSLKKNYINSNKRDSQDSQATETDEEMILDELEAEDEDADLTHKIQLINVKKFLIDLTCWQFDLLNFELFEISHGIFTLLNKFLILGDDPGSNTTNSTTTNASLLNTPNSSGLLENNSNLQNSLLLSPLPSKYITNKIVNIFINAIAVHKLPNCLMQIYSKQQGVLGFITKINNYYEEQQQIMLMMSNGNINNSTTPNNSNNIGNSDNNTPRPLMKNTAGVEGAKNYHQMPTPIYSTPPNSRNSSTSSSTPYLNTNGANMTGKFDQSECTSVAGLASINNTSLNTTNNSSIFSNDPTSNHNVGNPHRVISQQPSPITPIMYSFSNCQTGPINQKNNTKGNNIFGMYNTGNAVMNTHNTNATTTTTTTTNNNNNKNNNNSNCYSISQPNMHNGFMNRSMTSLNSVGTGISMGKVNKRFKENESCISIGSNNSDNGVTRATATIFNTTGAASNNTNGSGMFIESHNSIGVKTGFQ
ncbi:related to G1/S-specific cyclin CLN2 [Saccharomycodes ludwigii]|uniref:G1/S-specific cyclin n=1 Tax=Saccharomycodes ludwigii TaxID=36035 RepID=A0A376B2F4_9ASCO|nr:related to G1/S-specific cyclin CLN2 [Saccharomycodes ludwigii]